MRALAIDTSTDEPGVALWDGSRVAARSLRSIDGQIAAPQTQHAERLIGLIDDVLREAGFRRSDLELVACCTGPGSFTGVRVGVATAKGIAFGLGVPLVGVGSLEAMALGHLTNAARSDEAIIALLDARKGELFWAAYDHEGALLAGPGHLPVDRAAAICDAVARPNLVFVGDFASTIAWPRGRVARAPTTDRPDPTHIARIAAERCAARGGDDLDALEPTYVRPPDITMPRTAPGESRGVPPSPADE